MCQTGLSPAAQTRSNSLGWPLSLSITSVRAFSREADTRENSKFSIGPLYRQSSCHLSKALPSQSREPQPKIATLGGMYRSQALVSFGILLIQFHQNKPPCFQTLLRPLNTYLFPMHGAVQGVRENHDVVQQLGNNQVVAM